MGGTCCSEDKEGSHVERHMKSTDKESSTRNALRGNYEGGALTDEVKQHGPSPAVANLVDTQRELSPEAQATYQKIGEFKELIMPTKHLNPDIGPFKYNTGETYEGQYLNKRRDGFGVCVFEDGGIYEGQWDRDKMEGEGRQIFCNGDVYEGNFVNNLPDGEGKLTHPDGSGYQGQWIAGSKNGKGDESWPDGTRYIGPFKENKKHGNGVFYWQDKSTYSGDFVNNVIEGYGKGKLKF